MVGSIFGKLLAEAGEPVDLVVSRTPRSARRAARYIDARRSATSLTRLSPGTRLILITTPHAAIETVAAGIAELTHLDFERLFVAHASGMLTAAVLGPLAARGARVFSFHPLQSFPRNFRPAQLLASARGITYGIDGAPEALAMARKLARRLGGIPWQIPPELRTYYHAASVVASTHVAALTSMLQTMFATLGGGAGQRDFYRVYGPLVHSTLHLVETRSPELALGGAIARGGVDTLTEHLQAVVATSPALGFPFSAMCAQAIALARQRGAVKPGAIDAMRLAVANAAGVDVEMVAP
jgi:predicted short-subunit dehydrogenase-like oxidoreductase (DUF2520 family)